MSRALPVALAAWLALAGLTGVTAAWAAAADAELTAGNEARDRGDYAAAIGHYRLALASDPQSYEVKFQLARLLSYTRQREEAIRLYTELLSTRPANSDLLLARGRTYAWEGRWSESEADLTAVSTLLPEYGDAWAALGDLYLWSDRPAGAIQAYTRWVSVQPNEPGAYLARSRAYRSSADRTAARADLEKARASGATDAEVDPLIASLEQRPSPAATQPGGLRWLAHVGDTYSNFSAGRSAWSEYDASVRGYFPRGSLAVESLGAQRFSLTDHAFALDGYTDAWSRAYLNLRYQYSPHATLYPQQAYRAELFQGSGRGWEPSLSYDHMSFTHADVDMYGVGLGKYVGNWYLRWRTLFIPSTTGLGVSHRAVARYYFSGNADDYVELNGGLSHGNELLPHSVLVNVTSSWTAGAQIQKFFTPRWGIWLTGSVNDEHTSSPFVERDASLTLLFRW
ncbi:MAG: YaiO family outer membrane beta-barrel protein [Gammaproteobacteria bacterium]|nr:MAG: YaiO family outer membrane beta-barrel protein [Gammaproteobacteria bacterium]TLY88103.1 MAG: YaiO family outer membrane beta-barrel protein [Gammaproteobacteria bacterium]